MAFPTVQARNTSIEGIVTSHTVALPADIAAGDLLVVEFCVRNNAATTATFPAGWDVVKTFTNSDADTHTSVARKVAEGTEGASITVTTNNSGKSAHLSMRITGHENPGTQDLEFSTATTGDGSGGGQANPDPGSLTPTGGAKDYLWFAMVGMRGSDIGTAPTNYANLNGVGATGGTGGSRCLVAAAERQLNAASENPGNFSGFAAASWGAVTMVVHPSSGAAPPPEASGTVTGVGTVSAVGHITKEASGTVTAVGSLSAVGHVTPKASGTVSAVGRLTAVGHIDPKASGIVSAVGSLTATGYRTSEASGTVTGIGSLSAVGQSSPTVLPARLVLTGSLTREVLTGSLTRETLTGAV